MKKTDRRLVFQLGALAFLNMYFIRARHVCVPVLNCHSCPAAVFACPVGTLVSFSRLRIFPFFAIGTIGFAAAVAGRLFCGWACPFGLLQDGMNRLRVRRIRLPRAAALTRYAVLALGVVMIPFLFPEALSFCSFCPAGTLQASIPWRLAGYRAAAGTGFALRLGALAAVLALALFVKRGFCRLLCPLGALLSLFNPVSLLRMRLSGKCRQCGACARVCPVEIDPVKDINSPECVRCLDCTRRGCLEFGAR